MNVICMICFIYLLDELLKKKRKVVPVMTRTV